MDSERLQLAARAYIPQGKHEGVPESLWVYYNNQFRSNAAYKLHTKLFLNACKEAITVKDSML